MIEERRLCLKTLDKVYGIDVLHLLSPPKKEVSWDSLPPLPVAFKADLPAFCTPLVEFDSSFFLFGGLRYRPVGDSYAGPASLKAFQLHLEEDGNKQKHLACKEVDSFPKPPMCYGMIGSEHVEIRGDHYFISFNPKMPIQALPDSFWVLRSRSLIWQSLPAPPLLGVSVNDVVETQHFVFGEKIYFQTIYVTDEAYNTFRSKEPTPCIGEFESVLLYSFDPFQGDGTWTIHGEADKFIDSFSFTVQGRRRFHCPIMTLPSIAISGPQQSPIYYYIGLKNCSIHLSTSHIERSDAFGGWENGYKAIVHALLVSERGVRAVQAIEGLFDGIQPTFDVACPALVLVHDNLVCALLIGFAREYYDCECPLVCISVFRFSVMVNAIAMDKDINCSAAPEIQNFLDIQLISKHVYSMVDYLDYILTEKDLYPFVDEIKGFLWTGSRDLSLPPSPPSPMPKRPKF